jgi:hypothetical protein
MPEGLLRTYDISARPGEPGKPGRPGEMPAMRNAMAAALVHPY